MYDISIGDRYGAGATLSLIGCPASGLPAIDWRTAHGLPAEPTDRIALSGPHRLISEPIARALAGHLDASADLELAQGSGSGPGLPHPAPVSGEHARLILAALAPAADEATRAAALPAIQAMVSLREERAAVMRAEAAEQARLIEVQRAVDSAAVLAAGVAGLICVGEGYRSVLAADGSTGGEVDGRWRYVYLAAPALVDGLSARPQTRHLLLSPVAADLVRAAHDEARRLDAEDAARIPVARAALVAALGTPDQVERHAAGVLPESELRDLVRSVALAPIADWPTYERLTASDLPGCERASYEDCAASELTASQWSRLRAAQAALATLSEIAGLPVIAAVEARTHTATCRDDEDQTIDRLALHAAVEVPAADLRVTRVLALD